MSVGEALTNLVFAPITDLKDVKCSGNWMWPAKLAGEGAELVSACRAMCSVMKQLGIAVDGGKDSLSMAANVNGAVVKSPGTLVISAYAACPDITKVITPDLKCPGGKGRLLYIPFGCAFKNRVGGSALAQCFSQIGNSCPDMDSPEKFVDAFRCTQQLIFADRICSGHDVSDGGLLVCALEMAFAGNCSLSLKFREKYDAMDRLFAEELGIVIEVDEESIGEVVSTYDSYGISTEEIGFSILKPNAKVVVECGGSVVVSGSLPEWRDAWEETSCQLEELQSNEVCAESERRYIKNFQKLPWKITFPYSDFANGFHSNGDFHAVPSVAVIREEGSNGDREMGAAFLRAGFRVVDVCMEDLLSGSLSLDEFQGLAFVGGFSYADVLGSAKGWACSVLFNERLKQEFNEFFHRKDTFSLGICNGCQLMAYLGWIGQSDTDDTSCDQRILLEENDSGRFESRFSTVKIAQSPSVLLRGMEGSILGVWVSHGEGKFSFRHPRVLCMLEKKLLIPLRYVDEVGRGTERYPMNPNGSPKGIAGVCSPDGRHLALMPHPERCFLTWQWPYWPKDLIGKQSEYLDSPWMKMYRNAYNWCLSR